MLTSEEILTLASQHKRRLWKYYCSNSDYLPKDLASLKKHELNAILLHTIDTPKDLCLFLHTWFYELEDIMKQPIYQHFEIPKKKGGKRSIFDPEQKLKRIQRQLNYFLQAYYLCIKPEGVHGFVVNPHYLGSYCNIAANALPHVGKNQVLNIDLKDFFPSITAHQVYQLFTSSLFKFDEQIATAFTLLTTYEGKLPIGSPTSPVISNFICLALDSDLNQFCECNNLTYTRYADDLTFSSNEVISNDSLLDIINLIKKNKFAINEQKLRLKTKNSKQTVTGLVVNEKVNVDRKLIKKTRAMLHDFTMNGIDKAASKHLNLNMPLSNRDRELFITRLKGYIHFIGQVRGKNDIIFQKLLFGFDSLFELKTLTPLL